MLLNIYKKWYIFTYYYYYYWNNDNIYIYIYIHSQDAMGKLSPLYIINFTHALHLFQVLSTVQQTKVSWPLSVRKVAQWWNSHLQIFGNGMLYYLGFTAEAPVWRFQNVWVSIWRQIHIHIEENQTPSCPVGWGCRIHWLHFCRGVRPLPKWVSRIWH